MDKSRSKKGSMVPREEGRALTIEQVMKHPAVMELTAKLEAVKSILQQLPQAIGQAVDEAMRNRPPAGASGPPVPLVGGSDFGFERRKITVDGVETVLEPPPAGPLQLPRTIQKGSCR